MRVNKKIFTYILILLLDIKIGDEITTSICFVKMGSLEATAIRAYFLYACHICFG